jgi:hypothetical protein
MHLLGLTMGGTLMAVIKSAGDKPSAWWDCAVLAAMASWHRHRPGDGAVVTG